MGGRCRSNRRPIRERFQEHLFDEDERAQFRGEPPRRQLVVGDDPSVPASYRTKDAISFYLQPLPPGGWTNEVTVRSGRLSRMHEPGAWISRISLPMIVALADHITLTDLELRATYDMLSKLSGAAFDREFAKMMVSDHKKDIKKFKKEAEKKNDPAAHYASETLPTLHKHLQLAEGLNSGRASSQ